MCVSNLAQVRMTTEHCLTADARWVLVVVEAISLVRVNADLGPLLQVFT